MVILESPKEADIILLHEHVFNLYPPRKKQENKDFTLSLLEQLSSCNVRYIVDLTPYANLNKYSDIINGSPIPIICSIGFSYGKHVPAADKKKSTEAIYQDLERLYLYGIGRQKIRPGIIKLSTNTKEPKAYEHSFADAAIRLSNKYLLPIAYHCPFNTFDRYRELLEKGINPRRLMVCHYENQHSRMSKDEFLEQAVYIALQGSYLQFSDFGTKATSEKAKSTIDLLNYLVNYGLADKILLSSDCNWSWKNGLPKMKVGNMELGYRYLFDYTLPLLKKSGVPDEILESILKTNPKAYLGMY